MALADWEAPWEASYSGHPALPFAALFLPGCYASTSASYSLLPAGPCVVGRSQPFPEAPLRGKNRNAQDRVTRGSPLPSSIYLPNASYM